MNDYNVINTPSVKENDWNASEGEKGYIKNRTHYTETVENNIEWTFNLPENANNPYIDDNPDSNLLNTIYNVFLADKDNANEPTLLSQESIIINGDQHDCYFFYVKNSTFGTLVLSSVDNPFADSSNFDFSLFYLTVNIRESGANITYAPSWYKVGENNITIPYTTENVVKIDSKYLPKIDIPEGLKNIKDAENGGVIEGLVNGEAGQVNVASGLNAHAEGGRYEINEAGRYVYYPTSSSGISSHAEGISTVASGRASHAEGSGTIASGEASHSEGASTTASGRDSHAEGYITTASGVESHAEGNYTTASGYYSHAEGSNTTASGSTSHTEGMGTVANHAYQHVFGEHNIADPSTAGVESRGTYVEIVGNGNDRNRSNARTLDWSGNEWLAGKLTVGTQPTEDNDVATKKYVDENSGGLNNIKDAENGGIIEGLVEGEAGQVNVASGKNAHVEGGAIFSDPDAGETTYVINQATGECSHAEGSGTTASGFSSHAEGGGTTASAPSSHSEGNSTTASSIYSHAEGSGTTASGQGSHAEGGSTTASGSFSHAEGMGTVANHKSQHVFGEYNIEDSSTTNETVRGNYIEIVGNGAVKTRSNARTLDWSGNEWISGSMRAENGFILKSPDGSLFTLTVANDGTLTATKNA